MAKNTSVILSEHFQHFIAEKIEEGRYASVSEVVRAGLRLLEKEEKTEKLRAAIQEGLDSPIVEDFDFDEFLDQKETKEAVG